MSPFHGTFMTWSDIKFGTCTTKGGCNNNLDFYIDYGSLKIVLWGF